MGKLYPLQYKFIKISTLMSWYNQKMILFRNIFLALFMLTGCSSLNQNDPETLPFIPTIKITAVMSPNSILEFHGDFLYAKHSLSSQGIRLEVKEIIFQEGLDEFDYIAHKQKKRLSEDPYFDAWLAHLSQEFEANVFVIYVKNVVHEEKEVLGLDAKVRFMKKYKEFIFISSSRRYDTLAHEMGHYLGLDHVEDNKVNDENIMCLCRRATYTHFTPEQGVQMRSDAVGKFFFSSI